METEILKDFFKEFSYLLDPLATLLAVVGSGLFGVYLFNKGIQKERKLSSEKLVEEQKVYEQQKAQEELARVTLTKQLVVALIESIIIAVRKEIECYDSYLEELKRDSLKPHLLKRTTHKNIDRLHSFDLHDLIKLYINTGVTANDMIRLISKLDFIKAIVERVIVENDRFIEESTNQRNMFVRIREDLLQHCAFFLSRFDRNSEFNGHLYEFVNQTLYNYTKERRKREDLYPDLSFDAINLFEVIRQEFIKEVYRTSDFCLKCLEYAREALSIKKTLEYREKLIVLDITAIKDKLEETADEIDQDKLIFMNK